MLCKVEGGTGAGQKRERIVPKQPWTCTHGHTNKGFAANCLSRGCLEKRTV